MKISSKAIYVFLILIFFSKILHPQGINYKAHAIKLCNNIEISKYDKQRIISNFKLWICFADLTLETYLNNKNCSNILTNFYNDFEKNIKTFFNAQSIELINLYLLTMQKLIPLSKSYPSIEKIKPLHRLLITKNLALAIINFLQNNN